MLTRDPFVKLHILPDEKFIAQSSCKRRTNKPNYDETFQIYLAPADLQRCYLRMSVYDGIRLKQQSVIGEVMFPLVEMDNEKITETWRDLERPTEVSILVCNVVTGIPILSSGNLMSVLSVYRLRKHTAWQKVGARLHLAQTYGVAVTN